MTILIRRALLALLSALGAAIGGWALLAPASFFTDFPGFGLHFVSADGPFNEHLVRDVGALYLALAAAGVASIAWSSTSTARVVAIAWLVFSVPHLAYHLAHLHGLDIVDAIVEPLALAVTVLLPLPLLLPLRKARS